MSNHFTKMENIANHCAMANYFVSEENLVVYLCGVWIRA